MDCRDIESKVEDLHIPEPGKRIHYYGHVVRVERVIPRVKAYRIKGIVRYGAIQIILPRECVGKPAYTIVYVLSESDKFLPYPERKPLERVVP